ncbi:hypothetical protein ElyMa_005838500 [Elysia marginata]|uniref:Uncharacterized protein n=1 Tax=Elysia marginata TaxID=1093978 RepID=A0AAV4G0E0_9GAST|nr:hypothetical protein ElyMa_005838500 [Elysia marginata]
MGRGEYRLHEDFKEYFVQPAVWCTKTEQRRRHMEKFERTLKIKRSMATSSDGDIYVLTSGARGKKIGQKKRVKASRTGLVVAAAAVVVVVVVVVAAAVVADGCIS